MAITDVTAAHIMFFFVPTSESERLNAHTQVGSIQTKAKVDERRPERDRIASRSRSIGNPMDRRRYEEAELTYCSNSLNTPDSKASGRVKVSQGWWPACSWGCSPCSRSRPSSGASPTSVRMPALRRDVLRATAMEHPWRVRPTAQALPPPMHN